MESSGHKNPLGLTSKAAAATWRGLSDGDRTVRLTNLHISLKFFITNLHKIA